MSRKKSTGKTKQGKSGKGKKQGKRIHINKYAQQSKAAQRLKGDQEKGLSLPILPPEAKSMTVVKPKEKVEQPHTNIVPKTRAHPWWEED